MGENSVWGVRAGGKVRLTVFKLNHQVGLAVQQDGNTPPIFLAPDAALSLADQLLDNADECMVSHPETISLGPELEESLAKASKDCWDLGF